MRLVLDTNTVVSGLLWAGAPRHLLDAARAGQVTLHTTLVLLAELDDVLRRPKFAARLNAAGVAAPTLVVGYAALATLVAPAAIAPVVLADPDDDAVLACAIAAQADAIVSGDQHVLALGSYHHIPILTAPEALTRLPAPGRTAIHPQASVLPRPPAPRVRPGWPRMPGLPGPALPAAETIGAARRRETRGRR